MNLLTDFRHFTMLRRLGEAAFVFFLIKGLLWLAAPLIFILLA